ncbi:MAG: PBP1A family penicillin-binding protein [Gaiellales bacterium]
MAGSNGQRGNGHLGPFEARRRARRRRRERKKRSRLGRRGVLLALVLAAFSGVGIVVAGSVAAVDGFKDSCDLSYLAQIEIGQNSFVYAADGSFLGTIEAERNRQPLTMDQMGDWIPQATVAVEDRRFWEHGALDYQGLARAALANFKAQDVVEGGSTITQQLVRNLYRPVGFERTLDRKLKEACLSLKLYEARGREWILETYLNQVYYGNRAYGVEAAAQTYFSKTSADLTLPEAAMIAGLPQAPSAYDPFRRQEEAFVRRNDVLHAMLVAGQITKAQYEQAVATPIELKPGRLYTEVKEPFFFSFVRDQLIREYGANFVRTGGLRIYTTIDPRFQRFAKQAIRNTLNLSTDPASAIVSINPANGAIRAMVSVSPGGRNSQFNLAAQGRRQAGSSFKTFVLAEAIRRGINPDTTIYVSAPFRWQPDPQSEPWEPQTFDGSYYGPSTLTEATLRSDNSVYARLTLDLGPESVAKLARELGIHSPLQPVASIGLGSNEVTVLDMSSAYATLASGGVYHEPFAIRRVELPNGEKISASDLGRPEPKRVIPEAVAYHVTRILEKNVLGGTGTRAYFGRPAAGKTGTTDDFTDAWFVGYTPTLSTAVWVGYPNAKVEMTSVHGIAVSGGSFPAIIWNLFVSRALAATPVADFLPPAHEMVWRPWKGQYQLEGDTSTTETDTTKTDTTETKPATTGPAPPPTITIPTEPTEPPPTTGPTTTAPPEPPPPPEG